MSPPPDGVNAQSRWPCHPHLQSLIMSKSSYICQKLVISQQYRICHIHSSIQNDRTQFYGIGVRGRSGDRISTWITDTPPEGSRCRQRAVIRSTACNMFTSTLLGESKQRLWACDLLLNLRVGIHSSIDLCVYMMYIHIGNTSNSMWCLNSRAFYVNQHVIYYRSSCQCLHRGSVLGGMVPGEATVV